MSKQKVKEPYSMKNFAKGFFWKSIIILYVVLMIGNFFLATLDTIFVRYIPIGITGFLVTYFIIKNSAKKLQKSDKSSLKQMSFIFPIIIAVIMLMYGLYSVSLNIRNLRNKYDVLLESSIYAEEYATLITDSKNQANINWLITSIAYLVFAELGAFLIGKKLDDLLQEDKIEPTLEENVVTSEGTLPVDNDEKVDLTASNPENVTANNTIKWDL